jgi:L-lactate dehydrogenase complex protein LldE
MNVPLFVPCFIDHLYPQVAFNTIKILEKAGCTVTYPENQTCCGQPAFNAGYSKESRDVCRKFIKDFEHSDYIVAPGASCVGFVRNYYSQLFDQSSQSNSAQLIGKRIFELCDFLVNIRQITNFDAEFSTTVTYHDSCAALRECNIKSEPRLLLANVKGLELVEMNEVETCCGFGGSFAVKFEPISIAMADQKISHAIATKATHIVSTDMSCLMHLEGRIQSLEAGIKTIHIADILANNL